MKLKTYALIFISCLLLACGGAPSVEKLVKDDALFKQTFEECTKMGRAKAREEEKCVNAALAMKEKLKKSIEDSMKK